MEAPRRWYTEDLMSPIEQRIRAVASLRELAIAMRRENLKRTFPHESTADIEARLYAWLMDPGPPPQRLGTPPEPAP